MTTALSELSRKVTEQGEGKTDIVMSYEFAIRFVEEMRRILAPMGMKIEWNGLWKLQYRNKNLKVSDTLQGDTTFVLK
jgi:hypothetical protein